MGISHGAKVGFLACVSFATSHTAFAQTWEVTPVIDIVASYSDNLYLAEPGLEDDGFVFQVNPGISIEKDEGRFSTSLNYRAQALFFEDDSDFNTVYHQLDALGTLEVASDLFFLDFDASADQFVVDPVVARQTRWSLSPPGPA